MDRVKGCGGFHGQGLGSPAEEASGFGGLAVSGLGCEGFG